MNHIINRSKLSKRTKKRDLTQIGRKDKHKSDLIGHNLLIKGKTVLTKSGMCFKIWLKCKLCYEKLLCMCKCGQWMYVKSFHLTQMRVYVIIDFFKKQPHKFLKN